MPLIVTNCTARKRGAQAALTLGAELRGGSLVHTVSNWKAAAAGFQARIAAGSLYTGRAIVETRRAAQSAKAQLFFVSAGMGLISADDEIPSYDLTASGARGTLGDALRMHSSSAAEWWTALSANGLSRLISEYPDQEVLVALPATYLEMVELDLDLLEPCQAVGLRIFTSTAGEKKVPAALRGCVMPYDERLESVPGFAGTRGDFPQRALRHFVERLGGLGKSLCESRAAVENALLSHSVRTLPERRRLDDNEVRAIIAKRWSSCDGRSAHLLRALRDEEAVACEQSRFAQLWREVRDQMARQA